MKKLILKFILNKAITNEIKMDAILEKMVTHPSKTDFAYRSMQAMIRMYIRRIDFWLEVAGLLQNKKNLK